MADRRAFWGSFLLFTAAVAAAAKPRPHKDPLRPPLRLESEIPTQFGNWIEEKTTIALLPTPDVQEKLNHIYNQQIIRGYRNAEGAGIMLLIAYGEDQLELTTQTHLPEVCYPAQGFDILDRHDDVLKFASGSTPVVRMFAKAPGRSEPLTYWITMGDSVLQSEYQRRLSRVRYNLTGIIPDGMLVRASCIDPDVSRAWTLQTSFLTDLFHALSQPVRIRVFGEQSVDSVT